VSVRVESLPETSVLRVDAAVHAVEVARFARFVVRGPGPRDCWLLVGAIADDGYGPTISWTQDGGRRTLSAHRFALLLAAGTLDHQTFGEHHCNETLCVRVDPTHLHPGTQSANLRYAVSLGRHRGCLPTDIDPRGRHGRAHAIRAALTGGYDPLRLAAARTGGYDLLSPTLPLFDLSTR